LWTGTGKLAVPGGKVEKRRGQTHLTNISFGEEYKKVMRDLHSRGRYVL